MSTEGRESYRDELIIALHDLRGPDGPPTCAALADAVLAVPNPEVERLHTWDGLMSLLDEHWPEDVIPTLPDNEDRDPGPRIVSLLRWVERLSQENARLAAERDHAAAAAEGSHEGIRLWMLDCAALTQKHRDRADRAEAQLAEAKKKIEDLSSSLARVRDHAYHQRRTSQGRITDYVKADEILAILDNPPPGDTP